MLAHAIPACNGLARVLPVRNVDPVNAPKGANPRKTLIVSAAASEDKEQAFKRMAAGAMGLAAILGTSAFHIGNRFSYFGKFCRFE